MNARPQTDYWRTSFSPPPHWKNERREINAVEGGGEEKRANIDHDQCYTQSTVQVFNEEGNEKLCGKMKCFDVRKKTLRVLKHEMLPLTIFFESLTTPQKRGRNYDSQLDSDKKGGSRVDSKNTPVFSSSSKSPRVVLLSCRPVIRNFISCGKERNDPWSFSREKKRRGGRGLLPSSFC